MTVQELAELVEKMRNAQREFFRTRSASALQVSKRLEKQVDNACQAILTPQRTLFGDE